MSDKIITPERAERLREFATAENARMLLTYRIAKEMLGFLVLWQGRRVDVRIREALAAHLKEAMPGDEFTVLYEKVKLIPGTTMTQDHFKLEVYANRNTARQTSVSMNFAINFTAHDIRQEFDRWAGHKESIRRTEAILKDLPTHVANYNAAQEALAVALAPMLNKTGSYVVHPFSDYFQW